MGRWELFSKGGSGSDCLMLCRFLAMGQATVSDGQFLDFSPSLDDGAMTPKVDVGGGEVAEALVVATVVVLIDEGADLRLQIARQVVVFCSNRLRNKSESRSPIRTSWLICSAVS